MGRLMGMDKWHCLFIFVACVLALTATNWFLKLHQSHPQLNSTETFPEIFPTKAAKIDVREDDSCFCQLKGDINSDCSCQVETVDQFNNYKIYPRLQSILMKNYFRFMQINLNKECPFWFDDSTCAFEFCQVKPCTDDEVPQGLKEQETTLKLACADDLGTVNTSISAEFQKGFEKWEAHDAITDFCTVRDEEDSELQYVDLTLNPERFTGYGGPSAHRVWNAIYNENCFRETVSLASPFSANKQEESCIEKRTFYRAISGLHSSINIHLSAKYLLSNTKSEPLLKPKGDLEWGPNLTEFRQHFENALTKRQGSEWLKNLYFLYLLELRAIWKISPFLQKFDLYTGDANEDLDAKAAIKDLLRVVESFPYHFEEKALFSRKDAAKLKSEFHEKFTNIIKIMDCVGCQKCKLWGKLQIKGLGTALKILFSDEFTHKKGKDLLTRNEIVALMNSFGRLSESIYELENFRQMIQHKTGGKNEVKNVKSAPFF